MAGRSAPLVSLESLALEQRQRAALNELKSQGGLPTAVFNTWAEIQASWEALDGSAREHSLGYIAALWANLNRDCAGLDALALLNQFVWSRFPGIPAKKPGDFNPVLAPDERPWHRALAATIGDVVKTPSAAHEGLLDALLAQYGALYEDRLRRETEQLLSVQLDQLPLAASCLESSLIRLERIDWNHGQPGVLDLLARLRALPARGAAVAAQLTPRAADDAAPLQQLLGLWAEHTPWFSRFLDRHCPTLLPRRSTPPPPPFNSLTSGGGCDLHTLVVGAGASPRHWLLASEACADTELELVPLPGASLEASRNTWQTGSPAANANATPEVYARRSASGLARLGGWELPNDFFRGGDGSGKPAPRHRDARMVQLSREALEAEQLCSAVALFDVPRLTECPLAPYLEAVVVVERQLRAQGGSPEGFSWCLAFDHPPVPGSGGSPPVDADLQDEYLAAVQGRTLHTTSARASRTTLMEVTGDNAEGFVQSALGHSTCRGSLAFSSRVVADLRSIAPLLDNLAARGFRTLGVCYTDSSHTEVGRWPSFAELWAYLHRRSCRATLDGRSRYLLRRFVSNLVACAPSDGQPAGESANVVQALSRLSSIDGDSTKRRKSEGSRHQIWQRLERRIGQATPVSSSDFDQLWRDAEGRSRKLQHALDERQTCLREIAASLLAELGIPPRELSHFARTPYLHDNAGTAPTEKEWAQLLDLAERPHPLEKNSLADVRQFHSEYSALTGSASHHCLLKDFGPDQPSTALLNAHLFRPILDVLFDPRTSSRDKTRLVLTLRGFEPDRWRQLVSLKHGEKAPLKQSVLGEIWREVLQADLALVYLLRMTFETGIALASYVDPAHATWKHRRNQLLRLLDAGGWAEESLCADIAGARATMLRIVDLWKDYYRYRGPHRAKKRAERVDSLKQEYEKLRKPLVMPELNTDLSLDKVESLERNVYLAAHCLELIHRIEGNELAEDEAATATSDAIDVDAVSSSYGGRATALMADYARQKARYSVLEAAYALQHSQWLKGTAPDVEMAPSNVLQQAHLDPAKLASKLSQAVASTVKAHRSAQGAPPMAAESMAPASPVTEAASRNAVTGDPG